MSSSTKFAFGLLLPLALAAASLLAAAEHQLAFHSASSRETIEDARLESSSWRPPVRPVKRQAANNSSHPASENLPTLETSRVGAAPPTNSKRDRNDIGSSPREDSKKVEQPAGMFVREDSRNQSLSTNDGGGGEVLRIQMTAIHVDKSEFPLSKLLFKLTLRLALSEASRFLEQQALLQLQRRQDNKRNNQRQQLLRVKLKLSVRSANTCSRQYAAALAAEEFYVKRSRLFIVSGCDDAIRSVSRLASNWQVPIMTAAGFGADLNDKSVHRTLVRVAFSLRAAVEFLFKILKSFQWRRINLIVDESDANSQALRGSIEQHALKASAGQDQQQHQVEVNVVSFDLRSLLRGSQVESRDPFLEEERGPVAAAAAAAANASAAKGLQEEHDEDKWPNELTEKVVYDTLWQCSTYSRVSVLLIPQEFVRKFMLSAHDQNMANGHYTFINMPLLAGAQETGTASTDAAEQQTASGPRQSYAVSTGEDAFLWRSARSQRNVHAKQAFESLMSIYLRAPTTKAYVYFASKLTDLANTGTSRAAAHATAPPAGRGGSSHKSAAHSAPVPRRQVRLNINPYAASFYDGLQIYAHALNDSVGLMAAGTRPANGSQTPADGELHARISELVRNRRFHDLVTGSIYINQNGDRETDYTLDDMNQMTGKFAPVILYRGETHDIERLGRIHWSSDASVGPTSDTVDCTLVGACVSKPMSRFTFLLVLLAGPLVLALGGLFYFVHSKLSLESQLVDHWWKIHLSDIEIVLTRRKNANDGSLVLQQTGAEGSLVSSQDGNTAASASANRLAIGVPGPFSKVGSVIGVGGLSVAATRTEITKATDTTAGWASSALDACYGNITLGIYKLSKVALKPISKFHQSRKLMIELRTLKDISHNNLCRFVGILVDEGSLAIVSEFCPKGSLREFFHNESMVIDWTFKYSIINDILAGLLYIHSSALAFHGRLKSSNCLVSGRFVVKLSDYGPHSLYEQLDDNSDHNQHDWFRNRVWLAPEHMKPNARIGSMRGDVYSFGLLLYEVITNTLPFFSQERNDYVLPLRDLYQELKARGPGELMAASLAAIERDEAPAEADTDPRPLVELMQSCWRFEPSKRPSSAAINGTLKRITRGVTSKKLLENLTSRMEQYTNNLESLVEAKLACLVEEKQRSEELLYQFVPKSIASLLKEGQYVEPEAFECVTLFYSDIVGFTSLSSQSSPMEVVGFLSDLYLCFDGTLEQHDIFKVDTIGDAYIVASGLPQRNEGKHVLEIANAALELRDRLRRFRVPHKPEHNLEMRVGIHSGPCIAGIVGGLNMPKYCVFGDTLTTCKFMESSGLPMRIHITEESRALLKGRSDFVIEPRTPKVTRDGLPFQTYWLEWAHM